MKLIQDWSDEEQAFRIGYSDLAFCRNKPLRMNGGGLILCTAGTASLNIDLKHHRMAPGQEAVLFTQPAVMLESASPDFRARVMLCSPEMMHMVCHKLGQAFFDRITLAPVFNHSEETLKITSSYLDMMETVDRDTQNNFRTIIVSNLLRCLLLNISDKIRRDGGETDRRISGSRIEQLFDAFMDCLSKHAVHHRDVAYYAGRLCVTQRYLNTICRTAVGKSPKELIDEKAVGEIKILLLFSEMTPQQIADALHFPDQSYFGRYFKARTGFSPVAFKNSH